MKEVTFQVGGMSCGGCERAVETALGKLSFVSRVKADHKEGRVTVECSPEDADLEQMRATLNRMGYRA